MAGRIRHPLRLQLTCNDCLSSLLTITLSEAHIYILLQVYYFHCMQVFYFSFNWSISDKSIQVSRTLLSILADLNTAVVWMVLILPLVSSSPNLFSRLLGTIQQAPTKISIAITFMFHSFISSTARSKYCLSFSLLFSIYDLLE